MWKRVKGIVLIRNPRGEIDLEAEVLTYELGKVLSIAKGGRKSIHRFVNVIHPCNVVELWLSPLRGTSIYIVEAGDLVKVYKRVISTPFTLAGIMSVLHLVSNILPPFLIRKDVYRGLTLLLDRIDDGDDWYRNAVAFLLFLLKKEGYIPSFRVCDECGNDIKWKGRWLKRNRKVLCNRCGKGGVVISRATLNMLNNCGRIPFVFRVRLPSKESKELEAIVGDCSNVVPIFYETFLRLKHLNLKNEVRYVK